MQFNYFGNTGLKVSSMASGKDSAKLTGLADKTFFSIQVSAFALGGWLTYGGTVKGDPVKVVFFPAVDAQDIMKAAFEGGINTFDTAEVYANGQCEIEMGRVIKELGWKREEIVLISKIFFGTGQKHPNQNGLSRKHLIEGTRASLKRLNVEYLDIVFAHRHDPATPMEEIVRGFNFLIDQGLAFYWGTSEWSAAQIEEAHAVARRLNLIAPVAEQCHYSMLHREKFEVEYKPLFEREGYGTTVWSPLESGLLTGKYDEGVSGPRSKRPWSENRTFLLTTSQTTVKELKTPAGEAKLAKIRKLKSVADDLGCTRATLALAWAAKNPHVSTVILGASKPEQVTENLKALEILPKLTKEVLEKIEKILDNTPAQPNTFGRTR
ncbi:BQ5605_C010g06190 [Microbotryum silenes-dioicae]|uniref:BQ5605_C010g06190 protein n=1 Tax=Microbotryum silenes-dioicae TaxID=796604 RepID=A0A2X0LQP5_9BASI|nr:BQ5605_C010g06190 [Microbotryum silenes-dioicae]